MPAASVRLFRPIGAMIGCQARVRRAARDFQLSHGEAARRSAPTLADRAVTSKAKGACRELISAAHGSGNQLNDLGGNEVFSVVHRFPNSGSWAYRLKSNTGR